MTTYLMNPATGSVDTLQNWRLSFESMNAEEWGGFSFEDAGLVKVILDDQGDWIEA